MDIQTMLVDIVAWFNKTLIPLLMGIAVVTFFWNMVHYAFIKGNTDEGRESARRLMIWGVLAFVIITAFWGIINIFIGFFNLDNQSMVPDYVCKESNGGNCGHYQGDVTIPKWVPGSV